MELPPPWREPAALRRTGRSIRRLSASSSQSSFIPGVRPRAPVENRASTRRNRDQNGPPVYPNQVQRVLRRERKTFDGLKLPPASRAAGVQPETRHPFFASQDEERATQQHQYAGNREQLPELFHPSSPRSRSSACV